MNVFRTLTAMILLVSSAFVSSATVQVTGTVTRFLVQDGYAGGCMVQTTANLAAAGLSNCSAFNWISFDCDATKSGTKTSNKRMYDLAQMAYALGDQLRVNVTDFNRTDDGQCRAVRVDLQ